MDRGVVMRCYICDRILSPREIVFDKKSKSYKPCSYCLDKINTSINELEEDNPLENNNETSLY